MGYTHLEHVCPCFSVCVSRLKYLRAWCAFTFQKPFNPQSQRAHIDLQLSREAIGVTGRILDDEDIPRPGLAKRIASVYANLLRLAHQTIAMYCGARGSIAGGDVFQRSHEYSAWQDGLPYDLRLAAASGSSPSSEGQNHAVPMHAIVSLQYVFTPIDSIVTNTEISLQYYTAIVLLFLPIFHIEHISPAFHSLIRGYILQSARHGLDLLRRSVDGHLRYGYLPMTMQSIIHLGDTVARLSSDSNEKVAAIKLCAYALQQNRKCFQLAGPLLQLLRDNLRQIDPGLIQYVDEVFGKENQYTMDEILEACTRLTYRQPMKQITRFISPAFEHEWQAALMTQTGLSQGQHRSSLTLNELVNKN